MEKLVETYFPDLADHFRSEGVIVTIYFVMFFFLFSNFFLFLLQNINLETKWTSVSWSEELGGGLWLGESRDFWHVC